MRMIPMRGIRSGVFNAIRIARHRQVSEGLQAQGVWANRLHISAPIAATRQLSFWSGGADGSTEDKAASKTTPDSVSDASHGAATDSVTAAGDVPDANLEAVSSANILAAGDGEPVIDLGSIVTHGADTLVSLHSTISMDNQLFGWSTTLFLTGLAIRCASIPLVHLHQNEHAKAALVTKEMMRIQAYLKRAPGTLFQKYISFRRLRGIALRSAGTAPVLLFPWHLAVHVPVLVTASMSIRRIAENAPAEWATAGIPGVCPDIAHADPSGILPVANTALLLWNSHTRAVVGQLRDEDKHKTTGTMSANANSGDGTTAGVQTPEAGVRGSTKETERQSAERAVRRSERMTMIMQGLAVFAFPYMRELPAGLIMFWISSGFATALHRAAVASKVFRQSVGLTSAAEVAKLRKSAGPPVLQAAGGAVLKARDQLEYVQRVIMPEFSERRVNEALRRDINQRLAREHSKGRIGIELDARLRSDKSTGQAYIAIVRKGARDV